MVKYGSSIILASGSPRRIDMLREIGIVPRVLIPEVDETVSLPLEPQQLVMCLALKKALAAERQLRLEQADMSSSLMIAADTVVYAGTVLGKPVTEKEAVEMLRFLNGRTHWVYSGVCLMGTADRLRRVFYCVTGVKFLEYGEEDIRRYVATGESMDKAGAYAIQGGFSPYVEHITGPRDNVIGFPLGMIREELDVLGISLE
jgi:septum formation protein